VSPREAAVVPRSSVLGDESSSFVGSPSGVWRSVPLAAASPSSTSCRVRRPVYPSKGRLHPVAAAAAVASTIRSELNRPSGSEGHFENVVCCCRRCRVASHVLVRATSPSSCTPLCVTTSRLAVRWCREFCFNF